MKPSNSNALAALFFLIVVPTLAVLAQEKPGSDGEVKEAPDTAWLNDITRIPPGENREINPVVVEYNLSWNNVVNAGKLSVGVVKTEADGEDSPAAYLGGANGKSSGMARVLWPYDFEAASVVRQEDLRPIAFNLSEKERNRTLDYHILFESKQLVCSTTKPKDDGSEESVTHLLTYEHDFGQDLLSAILYLRSLPLEDEDEVNMVVTPFNRPYFVKSKVEGRETRKVKGEKYDTIKMSVEIGKIHKDLSIENYDKMKTATIWLTEDEYRLPLEIHADLFIGFVSARMKERKWVEEIEGEMAGPPEAAMPTKPSDPTATPAAAETASPDSAPDEKRRGGLLKRVFSKK
ncbi:MAG: DUF3108 domain-containing protein [Verrucomicrobiales bacterium]|nr:DUF3108 domain-containing protein [Verrucomicrobiales bacterium]